MHELLQGLDSRVLQRRPVALVFLCPRGSDVMLKTWTCREVRRRERTEKDVVENKGRAEALALEVKERRQEAFLAEQRMQRMDAIAKEQRVRQHHFHS